MKTRKLKNMSSSNKVFYVFNAILWALVLFITIYPLYLVVISSISNPDLVATGQVLLYPKDISFIGYESVFQNKEIWIGYANSLYYTVAHIVLSVSMTLLCAYAMSRKVFPGKKFINLYFVITMFINGGLIPGFLTIRNLGWYNTRWVLIFMGSCSVWNLMVARTFIQTSIPDELYEAAKLDGASHFQYFGKVVVPLSKTIMSVLSIYYGVATWNNYFNGLVYIKDRAKLPLQTVLREILAVISSTATDAFLTDEMAQASMEEAMRIANSAKYCTIVIATVPIVLLYILLQKHFEKGVMIGSLKG